MSFSMIERAAPLARRVKVTNDALSVELADGRIIAVPLLWYPRLFHATPKERNSWRLLGGGEGIHWPAVDEDISVANLLAGQPSSESQTSLKRWLEGRTTKNRKPRRDRS
jgi:hypothetical protein